MSYKRVLIKISGEALMGEGAFGIDTQTMLDICKAVKQVRDSGIDVAIVVGGGNIFRGIKGAEIGIPEPTAHHMGILATMMNGLAFAEAFKSIGQDAVALSSIPVDAMCPVYARWRALEAMQAGKIVICTGGTGNPFFTTDSGALLRAIELQCDATLKATQVDGIYNADPKMDPTAQRYEKIDYNTVLKDDLRVMDAAAIALARDNKMPIIVFSLENPSDMLSVIQGKGKFTLVQPD